MQLCISYGHSLPSAYSRRAVVSFSQKSQFLAKECAQILVYSLEDKACPGKVWLGKLTVLQMTLMG